MYCNFKTYRPKKNEKQKINIIDLISERTLNTCEVKKYGDVPKPSFIFHLQSHLFENIIN